MRSSGEEGGGETFELPIFEAPRRKGSALGRIVAAVVTLGCLLLVVGYFSVLFASGEINPDKAHLSARGYASREAIGCATERQLDRYYQEGEKNGDLAAMLAVGGGCRLIAQGIPYSVVESGFFTSRVVVNLDSGLSPLWVTNASLR